MKKEIFRVRDDENDGTYLDYNDGYALVERNPVITLEELADFCDGNAEGRNNHAYVGAHRVLAALFHHMFGRARATELLRSIAEYGGLDGMNGVGGEESAFADFGIADCWNDWKLPE